MAIRYMKRYSTSRIIKDIQLKTTWYHFTHVRMADIKRHDITGVSKDVEKREPLCTVGGSVDWYSCYGKQCGSSSKLKIEPSYDPSLPLLII